MAFNAIPNNGSQLERAVRQWFIDATADNTAEQGQLVADRIFVTNDSRIRDATDGLITLHAKGSQHHPEHTGTEIWTFEIQAIYPAAVQPDQENSEANRVAIDQLIGLADAAMRQTDDNQNFDATAAGITNSGRSIEDAENNADMGDFTCLFLRYIGASRGHPVDDQGRRDFNFWCEVRTYEITAAAVAIT